MNQIIKNIHLRNFRSLEGTSVEECGPLNVLIGKNNAGKSSVLAAIPILFEHLATARIASAWRTKRAHEQFTHRETSRTLQIGIELALGDSQRTALCDGLRETAPHLGKSIEQLATETSISIIFRFVQESTRSPYQFIESISVGGIDAAGSVLKAKSTILLRTPEAAAKELFSNYQSSEMLQSRVAAIRKLTSSDHYPLQHFFSDKRSYPARYLIDQVANEDIQVSPTIRRDLTGLLDSSESLESFRAKAAAEIANATDEIERLSLADIQAPLVTYTGEVRVQPLYITQLCKAYGEIPILKLGERKIPIGKKEATRLLQLKVKRGGPERLSVVQQTVKALLGVSLDAFQGEGGGESAEIDVDNFLAEANGAGIRESLRLILDIELESCEIVLLEEPEVHLHPGLEFAVHNYLQDKSRHKQFFVTTHSTNFIDIVSPQHIYLIARNADGISTCERLAQGDAPIKLPAELGIRLSTVFMFDRIVFVEGPSDESVLRELAATEGIDLNGAGVAFVHMGGVANFTHYAAQATLDLLSRRRVRMWFVVDRDERDETEIRKMVGRLGSHAKMFVLEGGELENFLIDDSAVCKFIAQKTSVLPSSEAFKSALDKVVAQLPGAVANMYLERELLAPIYLRGSDIDGDITARLTNAIATIQDRLQRQGDINTRLSKEISDGWTVEKASRMAPGELLLDGICKELGGSFQKQRGDSVKLARHLSRGAIPRQIKDILRALCED